MDANVTSLETMAREHLQLVPTAVLAAAARGDLDFMLQVRVVLAGRGVDLDGDWIGFPAAARLHLGDQPGGQT